MDGLQAIYVGIVEKITFPSTNLDIGEPFPILGTSFGEEPKRSNHERQKRRRQILQERQDEKMTKMFGHMLHLLPLCGMVWCAFMPALGFVVPAKEVPQS